MAYALRVCERTIRESLTSFGGLLIDGPRAVGKTTTALRFAASSVRLDASPDLIDLAEASPGTVLIGAAPRLVDDWQLAPALWNTARHEIDSRAEPGQFIFTGSAAPVDDVSRHSGAGRFRRITMRPMSLTESGESIAAVDFATLFTDAPFSSESPPGSTVAGLGGPTLADYAKLIVRGGWPALVAQPNRVPTDYLIAYLDDVARVDLRTAGIAVDPPRMKALIRALARNVATEASAERLAAESEIADTPSRVSAQSVRKYLDALTRVHVVEEQPAWTTHLRSKVRQRVSPKWHFVDPSLAAAAMGITDRPLLDDPRTLGFFFESLAIRDLRVYADTIGGSVTHYRDETGLEVDAIVELRDGRWAAFEIKLGGAAGVDAGAHSLHRLASKVSESRAARLTSLNIITAGTTTTTRSDGVNVIALGHLYVDL